MKMTQNIKTNSKMKTIIKSKTNPKIKTTPNKNKQCNTETAKTNGHTSFKTLT